MMLQLKQAALSSEESDQRVRESVETMLEDIARRGEFVIRELAKKFDNWEGDFVLSDEKKQGLIDSVPQQVKDDIKFTVLSRRSVTACNLLKSKPTPECYSGNQ